MPIEGDVEGDRERVWSRVDTVIVRAVTDGCRVPSIIPTRNHGERVSVSGLRWSR